MCCEGWNYPIVEGDEDLECPDCGEPVDCDGEAVTGCYYSPFSCFTCGARPCDGSC